MPLNTDIKILLVEDAAVMRKMELKTLKSLGFENVVEAVDGQNAIDILQSEKNIELIISDWNMPVKSGFDLLVWVRNTTEFTKLPFLMATGRGEKKEIAKAESAGVSSFISKPFDANELSVKIEEAFGVKEVQSKKSSHTIQQSGSGKVVLKIGHIQITDHLVLGILKHLIKSGELQPQTFELETRCLSSWNPVADSLEKGELDGACVLAPIAMDLFSYGVPIKLILFAHRNGSIFVRNKKGGQYVEPYQAFFRNKSFLLPHLMSIHHILAHMFFTGIGLNPGYAGEAGVDVSFEVVPPVKMPEILASNEKACGYLVAEPLGTKAIASGIAELQFISSEIWDNHPCCVVTVQKDLTEQYPQVIQEFTKMLVYAGKFIAQKPGLAAEIGVGFLDPNGALGLKTALIKNVLTEPKGIKTENLYPSIEELDRIQRYMHDNMGLGNIIDLEEFVDLRFANEACKDTEITPRKAAVKVETTHKAQEILVQKHAVQQSQAVKSLINLEGKYLSFSLGREEYGIDILKIKEIIKMQTIRTIPHTPHHIKGVFNLRGNVIPVIDLRLRFGMPAIEYSERTVIIVLEIYNQGATVLMGIIVDSVSEVSDIKVKDIEEKPLFGVNTNTDFIMAIAKTIGKVKILLDIDHVLTHDDTVMVSKIFEPTEA
ncbi:MAG TPA: chemotaxis protein CheW [bacterium]|nr:chemotaxis protein CheW [bacterium]HPN43089.1 chemotaxis protein CheW [bacterium]